MIRRLRRTQLPLRRRLPRQPPVATDDEAQQAPVAEDAPAIQLIATPTVEPVVAPTDPDWNPSRLPPILTGPPRRTPCRRRWKEGGEPWKAIASALDKSKKDIKARWKILQTNKDTNNTGTASAPLPAPIPAPGFWLLGRVNVFGRIFMVIDRGGIWTRQRSGIRQRSGGTCSVASPMAGPVGTLSRHWQDRGMAQASS